MVILPLSRDLIFLTKYTRAHYSNSIPAFCIHTTSEFRYEIFGILMILQFEMTHIVLHSTTRYLVMIIPICVSLYYMVRLRRELLFYQHF